MAIPAEPESLQPVEGGVLQVQGFPAPRIWLLNGDETELLQLQRDTFACNWRQQLSNSPYPRYQHVRSGFEQAFREFTGFTEQSNLGRVAPLHCEVSYVNHIPSGQGWDRFGEIHKVLSSCAGWRSDAFLSEPEEVRYSAKFPIRDANGQFLGRLNVAAQPALRRRDRQPLIVLTLTSRGRPIGTGMSGILGFFDIGREWIVRAFADLTTDEMHRLWGRTA